MKKVVTIAGSDSSGGAGIQADIKTMMAHGVFAMSAITALTAQNTTSVYDVLEATPEFVGEQIDCIFNDIRPDAVKIGMVSNIGIIRKIAEKLQEHHAENIVVDPVMVSTSGCALMSPDAQETLMTELLPLADIITPNIPDKKHVKWMTEYYYGELLKCGIRIYEYTPGFVHSKVVLEEHCAVVGTINMDYRSFYLHYENGIWIYNEEFLQEVRKDFDETFRVSREITYEEWKNRPIKRQVMQHFLKVFSTLV